MAVTLTTSYQLIAEATSSTYSKLRLYGKYKSQSIDNNTSTITLELRIYGNGGGSNGTYTYGGMFSRLWATGNDTYEETETSVSYTKGKETTLITYDFTITHDADGTALNKQVSGRLYLTDNVQGSTPGYINLPQIKRASVLSQPSDFTFGDSISATYTKYVDTYTNDLNLKINDTTFATRTNYTSGDSITLTTGSGSETETAYNLAPNTLTPTVTFELITKNNGNQIGLPSTKTVTATIPNADVTPSITDITLTDTQGYYTTIGDYVQGKSIISGSITASGGTGASVSSYSTSVDGQTITTNPFELTASSTGTITYTTTITDSRGLTATDTGTFDVIAYNNPTIDTFSIVRCDSNGDEDDGGSYVKINISSTITALNNNNTKEFKLQYKLHSSSTWTTLETYNSSYTYTKTDSVESGFSSSNAYDFKISAKDMFGTSSATLYLPTQKTVLDFYKDGTGVAIGKVASSSNLLDIGLNTKISGTLSLADEYGDNSVEMFDLTGTPRYDETSSYQTGDYVVYNNSLYKAAADSSNPAGTFDPNDWSATDIMTEIQSGGGGGGTSNYNDLTNKPSINGTTLSGNKSLADLGIVIPTVNNATLTIQKNGTNVNTFTANASSNVTANITVPTKTTDLTNDAVFNYSDVLAITSTSDATYTGIVNCITYNIPFKILNLSGDAFVYEVIKTHSGHHYESFQYIDDDNILHTIEMVYVGTAVTVTETTTTLVDTSDLSNYSTTSTLQTNKSITKGVEYIVGTQASATNSWTGTSTDTGCSSGALYTGKMIMYHLPQAGNSSAATLNLTLPDGTTTGAKNIYRLNNTTVTTNFVAGCDIFMVYDGTQWKINAYVDTSGSNTIGYQLRTNSALWANKTGYSMNRYTLLFEVDGGLSGAATTIATGTSKTTINFKYIPGGVIKYYSTSGAIANGSNFTANGLWDQYTINLGYTFNTGSTLTSGKPVYMRCTVNADGTLSPNYSGSPSHPIVQDLPTTADNKVYVYLGQAYSTTNIELMFTHPIYEYKNGKIRQYISESSGGTITDVQVNSTSVVSGGVADILTETAYDASTNKIATMSDLPDTSSFITKDVNNLTNYTLSSSLATVATSGNYSDLSGKPTIPTKVSDLSNDSGFITGISSGDVTTALGYTPYSAANPSGYTSNTGTITSVKMNGTTVSSSGEADLGTVITDISGKQDTLVSGTNIKTINNTSILGSGNISIGGGGTATDVQINGTSITSSNVANILTESAYDSSTNKIATMSDIPDTSSFIDKDVNNLTNYTLSSSLKAVATSGSYSDLTGTPTIPANTSDLNNDSGFITSSDIPVTNVKLNNTSVVSTGVAELSAEGTYNSSTNKLATETTVTNKTGTLSSLTTTANTNLVAAINEVNGNCDFEDFTSKVTFSETSRGVCYFIRVGKIVYVYYCGRSTTHTSSTVLATIPAGYRPSYQASAPFIKGNNAYGFLTFNDNGSKMTVNQISSTSATGRIYANFTYFLD